MEKNPYLTAKTAEHNLELARADARKCRSLTVEARAEFARCLEAWNTSQPVHTQEQATRAWIASNQEELARKAAAGQLPYRPGLNAMARAYGAPGGLNVKRGGGTSYRRGAIPRAQAMQIEAQKLRAAAGKP